VATVIVALLVVTGNQQDGVVITIRKYATGANFPAIIDKLSGGQHQA
jgi:hypothetical protein